jgi:hypothetical protein
MNARFYLLFCLILISSCQTPKDPFNRPKIEPTIANGDGTGFRDGEFIPDTTNMLCVDPNEYSTLYDFWDDIEFRLYICTRYPRRCK